VECIIGNPWYCREHREARLRPYIRRKHRRRRSFRMEHRGTVNLVTEPWASCAVLSHHKTMSCDAGAFARRDLILSGRIRNIPFNTRHSPEGYMA
jgi:hypothetical protein